MVAEPTKLRYYQEPYLIHLQSTVVHTSTEDDWARLYLPETIFFPQGGGQPSDQGIIKGLTSSVLVQKVTMEAGVVCHWIKADGDLPQLGDEVTCELDWDRRHWYMRVHTAGHLVHDTMLGLVDTLTPQRGEHGDNPYVKYKGTIDTEALQEPLESAINQLIAEDRAVMTEEATLEQLKQRAKFVPPNLPAGKPLRILQIEGFDAMPDGGVHVKSLGEIGQVLISNIRCKKGSTTIKYEVV